MLLLTFFFVVVVTVVVELEEGIGQRPLMAVESFFPVAPDLIISLQQMTSREKLD